jgi:hypothetical protein
MTLTVVSAHHRCDCSADHDALGRFATDLVHTGMAVPAGSGNDGDLPNRRFG